MHVGRKPYSPPFFGEKLCFLYLNAYAPGAQVRGRDVRASRDANSCTAPKRALRGGEAAAAARRQQMPGAEDGAELRRRCPSRNRTADSGDPRRAAAAERRSGALPPPRRSAYQASLKPFISTVARSRCPRPCVPTASSAPGTASALSSSTARLLGAGSAPSPVLAAVMSPGRGGARRRQERRGAGQGRAGPPPAPPHTMEGGGRCLPPAAAPGRR